MDGDKNLTSENLIKFSDGLKFNSDESEYFEVLVNFNQAKESLVREYYHKRLIKIRNRKKNIGLDKRTLSELEFECLSHWLPHTVMVMTNLVNYIESPLSISNQLYNLAGEDEVVEVMQTLEAIGLIKRDENGRYIQTNKRVKTKEQLQKLSAKLFYKSLFKRAIQSLDISTSEEREMNTQFVGVSKDQLPELKKKVRNFMSSLVEWAMENDNPEQVYSFVFSGFPLTKRIEK